MECYREDRAKLIFAILRMSLEYLVSSFNLVKQVFRSLCLFWWLKKISMAKTKKQTTSTKIKKVDLEAQLLNDVASIIEESKQLVAHTVNSALSLLYWRIGKRISA